MVSPSPVPRSSSTTRSAATPAWPASTNRARTDPEPYRDRGRIYSAVAYAGYAIGGAGLITACVLFLLEPHRAMAPPEPSLARAPRPRLSLAPLVSSTGGGLYAGGTF